MRGSGHRIARPRDDLCSVDPKPHLTGANSPGFTDLGVPVRARLPADVRQYVFQAQISAPRVGATVDERDPMPVAEGENGSDVSHDQGIKVNFLSCQWLSSSPC